MIIEIGHMA